MYITLFYYWGLIQWLELGGTVLLLCSGLYGWSRLWVKSWPGRNIPVILLCAVLAAWPVTMLMHQRVAEHLASGKYGMNDLRQGVERLSNVHLTSRLDEMAQNAADRQAFVSESIPAYASLLYTSNPSRYLPIDSWPAAEVDAPTRAVLEELYDSRGVSEYVPNSKNCDVLFKEVRRYLAEQEQLQNKATLKETYSYASSLFVLTVLVSMFICAQQAYHSINREYCSAHPFY